jgi:hypothetical protein
MASNVRFLDQVSVGTYQTSGGEVIDTGSFLINAVEDPSGSGIIFTRGNGNTFTVEVTSDPFPYTGSAIITGSLELEGPFLVKLNNGNGDPNKFRVNNEGTVVLGKLNTPPTAVSGGFFYSSSNEFFLGFA